MKRNKPYRIIAFAVAAAFLVAPVSNAGAAPASSAGFSRIGVPSVIEFVQDKPKTETMTQQVKRIWRNLTGYKFDVACPAFALALTRTTCTANGKNREDARAKCQSQNVFCQVGNAK
ncbi:MAG: hypothetical protein ACXWJ6_06185 [Xanthobacteraceae bacterium]